MFVFWDVTPHRFVEMYHMKLLPQIHGGNMTPTPKTKEIILHSVAYLSILPPGISDQNGCPYEEF
jgi:hypothetical protein